MQQFRTLNDVIRTALERMSHEHWNYVTGGAESETTVRRNRHGLDTLAFKSRVLRDVSHVDASTDLLGHRLRIPVMTAPIGSLGDFVDSGGAAAARGAAEFCTVPIIASRVEPHFEEIAKVDDNPKYLQLYVRGDRAWLEAVVNAARRCGYAGICMTADTPVRPRRERQVEIGYIPSLDRISDDERHLSTLLNWDLLAVVRSMWNGPLMVKGIMDPDDAAKAVEHGADVIYVSNHGGRALDHSQASIAALPAVAERVCGKARIVFDGGIVRGTDVLKALALGADAVAIGKLQAWALGAGGAEGLRRTLEILEDEIVCAMSLIGIARLEELDSTSLCDAPNVSGLYQNDLALAGVSPTVWDTQTTRYSDTRGLGA